MTTHVFTCSHKSADHVTSIDDDGNAEGAAFGVALRQTRARFVEGRCDAWVPEGHKGADIPCPGRVTEERRP